MVVLPVIQVTTVLCSYVDLHMQYIDMQYAYAVYPYAVYPYAVCPDALRPYGVICMQ